MGKDNRIGGLELARLKEFLDGVHDDLKPKGFFLHAAKAVNRSLGDLAGEGHAGRVVAVGEDLEPVLVVDENLHDARVNRPEHCLGDDLEVHCVRLPAHFGLEFE